jgi:hypothetical protein
MSTSLILQSYWHVCGFTMTTDIDPYSEYFLNKYPGIQAGNCPSCYLSSRAQLPLEKLTGPTSTVQTNTLDEADIDALTETEMDDNGNAVMIDSGDVKQEIGIVDGAPAIVETPIMVAKQRELTAQEKTEKSEEAQKNLDALASIAVSESTEADPAVERDS